MLEKKEIKKSNKYYLNYSLHRMGVAGNSWGRYRGLYWGLCWNLCGWECFHCVFESIYSRTDGIAMGIQNLLFTF